MATGTPPAKRKTNRQFQVLLVIWLMMFGLGVFAGVTLTKKAFGMPAWVHHLLGLDPIINEIQKKGVRAMPNTTPTDRTESQPQIPSTQSVVKPAEQAAAQPPTQPTEMNNNSSGTASEERAEGAEQKPQQTGMSGSEMANKVQEYNDLLNRVKNAEKSYRVAQKSAADKSKPQDLEPALAQQQTDIDEIKEALLQAQRIFEELQRAPQFEANYREDSLALTLYPVPPSIKETKADTLHFLKKRT